MKNKLIVLSIMTVFSLTAAVHLNASASNTNRFYYNPAFHYKGQQVQPDQEVTAAEQLANFEDNTSKNVQESEDACADAEDSFASSGINAAVGNEAIEENQSSSAFLKLERAIAQLSNDGKKANTDATNAETAFNILRDLLSGEEAKKKSLDEQIKATAEEMNKLNNEINAMAEQMKGVRKTETSLQEQKLRIVDQIRQIKEQTGQHEGDIKAHEAEIAKLDAKIQNIEQQKADFEQQLKEKEAQKNKMREEAKKAKALSSKIRKLQDLFEETSFDKVKRDINGIKSILNDMGDELTTAEATLASNDDRQIIRKMSVLMRSFEEMDDKEAEDDDSGFAELIESLNEDLSKVHENVAKISDQAAKLEQKPING